MMSLIGLAYPVLVDGFKYLKSISWMIGVLPSGENSWILSSSSGGGSNWLSFSSWSSSSSSYFSVFFFASVCSRFNFIISDYCLATSRFVPLTTPVTSSLFLYLILYLELGISGRCSTNGYAILIYLSISKIAPRCFTCVS